MSSSSLRALLGAAAAVLATAALTSCSPPSDGPLRDTWGESESGIMQCGPSDGLDAGLYGRLLTNFSRTEPVEIISAEAVKTESVLPGSVKIRFNLDGPEADTWIGVVSIPAADDDPFPPKQLQEILDSLVPPEKARIEPDATANLVVQFSPLRDEAGVVHDEAIVGGIDIRYRADGREYRKLVGGQSGIAPTGGDCSDKRLS